MIHIDDLAPLWLLLALVAAAVAVAIVARRFALPYSVALVLFGLALSIAGPNVRLPVSPDLLLAIVLPGLVFEAAFRTDVDVLRPAAAGVLLLAIPGVVVVAAIVALVLSTTSGLTFTEAFLVGAMVAATDPAAVLSTFRRANVPVRLATIVEMESLVNDGTGIVLFALAIEMLSGAGSLGGSIVGFAVSVVGGGLLGAVFGGLAARLVRGVDDHLTELAITVVLAYGTYLAADALGLSGVIATLLAAGIFGATARGGLTPRATEAIDVVWEFAAFLLTAGVFLLVGLAIAPQTLVMAAAPIAWGIVAILVGRAVVVYGLLGPMTAAIDRFGRRDPASAAAIPRAWLHVLFWAGLRGAVSVALALSLPAGLPNRELLQGIVFGIVLFTLIVQGTTSGWVLRRTGADVDAGA
ncbi:MAG TPA: cation:proton antiporter [Candidatus Limnocylindrales bacterium]|nr:cation:proton antiporter [Candidatus Limnocylindrales bacterium]